MNVGLKNAALRRQAEESPGDDSDVEGRIGAVESL